MIKFQMISRVLCDEKFANELFSLLKDKGKINSVVVRFDTSVNRALQYAVQDGLIIQQANHLYRLTTKGKNLADMIMKDNVMTREKEILIKIDNGITEDFINSIQRKWRQ